MRNFLCKNYNSGSPDNGHRRKISQILKHVVGFCYLFDVLWLLLTKLVRDFMDTLWETENKTTINFGIAAEEKNVENFNFIYISYRLRLNIPLYSHETFYCNFHFFLILVKMVLETWECFVSFFSLSCHVLFVISIMKYKWEKSIRLEKTRRILKYETFRDVYPSINSRWIMRRSSRENVCVHLGNK